MSVFENLLIPIPVCNIDFTTFSLPGDGTVQQFAQHLGENIGNAAVDIVIQKLGLEVSIFFEIIMDMEVSMTRIVSPIFQPFKNGI